MAAAKLPTWIDAIGKKLAERFDVSNQALPGEMEVMLRLIETVEESRAEAQSPLSAAGNPGSGRAPEQ